MKRILYPALISTALMAAMPAAATTIPVNSSGLMFSAFDTASRGTQLALLQGSGISPTIAGRLVTAVYRNSLGTLDFYYQVFRTGPGTSNDNMIDGLNVGDFSGFTVDGFVDGMNFDGDGPFSATNNGTSGSTTTVGRTPSGDVVRIAFGLNGLDGTENSATYILRTNAVTFTGGFSTVTNSTAFNVASFAPLAAAVPEPTTWAMMLVGFGLIGSAMRYRRRRTDVTFA